MNFKGLFCTVAAACSVAFSSGAYGVIDNDTTKRERMQWFADAKLGIFHTALGHLLQRRDL